MAERQVRYRQNDNQHYLQKMNPVNTQRASIETGTNTYLWTEEIEIGEAYREIVPHLQFP